MKAFSLFTLLAAVLQTRIIPPPPPPPPPVRVSSAIPQTGNGVIEGVVRRPDNGEPVADASITVTGPPNSTGAVPMLNVRTDSSGRFVLRNIPDGLYSVAARRENYWGPATASNVTGQRVSATVVMIDAASKTANVTLSLTPGGTIHGVVRNANGAAVPDSEVAVLRVTYTDGLRTLEKVRTARSGPQGDYRFAGLPPAEFYVRAEDITGTEGLAYFPGVMDPELAVPVRVRGGDEVITDLQMVAAPRIRISGTVLNTIPEQAEAPSGFMLIPADLSRLAEKDPSRLFANQLPPSPDGRFEILVTQPGTYHLMPAAPAKRDPARPVGDFGAWLRFFTGRVTVDVRDRDVDGVNVAVTRGSELTIRVNLPVNSPLAAWFAFRLRPLDPHHTQLLHSHLRAQETGPRGSVTFSNVPEGRYHLLPEGPVGLPFNAIPSGYYIQDVLQGGRSTGADGVITIRGETADPVSVVLGTDGGVIEVAIDGPAGGPGVQVSLVPQGVRRDNPMFFRRGYATNGTVRFTDVAPGDYRVFAWEDLAQGADENAAFMARYDVYGRSVSARANTTVAGIRVPLIPAR